MQRSLALVVVSFAVAACDEPLYTSPPARSPDPGYVEMRASPPLPLAMQAYGLPPATPEHHHHDEGHDDDEHDHDHDDAPIVLSEAASRVLILQTSVLTRPSEVVGVVDAHEKMGHHNEALAHLRARAAALGADAVVGVEFHHGEGEGEPTHLSGLAVRYLSSPP